MFRIRRAKLDDVPMLLKLAKMVHFINLPPDKDIIQAKIVHSRNSFLKVCGSKRRPDPEPTPPGVVEAHAPGIALSGFGTSAHESDLFMVVLEDLESGAVLGTSQAISRMGGPGNPQVSLKLSERDYFSTSLQTGTKHMVAQLHLDESGPSEIGGLILQPSYRGHKEKLGRFLSMIRFQLMGLYPKRFAPRVLAEMMAPVTSDGHNLVWDYLGRRFIPLSYDEADRFCQYSREFITSLLPREPIHLSLLPPTARAGIGEVGEDTKPARRMLERLGFEFRGYVDPFDGGPYLDCPTADIAPVRATSKATLGEPVPAAKAKTRCMVSTIDTDGEFRAIDQPVFLGPKSRVGLTKAAMAALEVEPGAAIGVTPFTPPAIPIGKAAAGSSAERTKRPAGKKKSRARSA
ncbi:MAG: arginine N-succinyltransferase [Planctomycetota bacterium]